MQDTNTPSRYVKNNHPEKLILGNENACVQTRKKLASSTKHTNLSLLSKIEPKNFFEDRKDEGQIVAMNEELNQIEKKQTWELVPRPKDKNVIGTKWVLRDKLNEDGKVVRNETRLVCKGYAQVEGIDFEETFVLVARLEAIRMFLEFACYKRLKVYEWM